MPEPPTVRLGVQHCPGPTAQQNRGLDECRPFALGSLPGSRRAVCTTSGGGTPSGLTMLPSLSMLRSQGRASPRAPWTALPITPQWPRCVEGSPWGEVPLCGEDCGPEPRGPAALLLQRLGSWGWAPGGWAPGKWRAPQHHPRGESVDHVGVSQDHEVQPATAPLPARGHAPLVAAALQQVPDLLRGDRGSGGCGDGARAGCPPCHGPLMTTLPHARLPVPGPGTPAPAEPRGRPALASRAGEGGPADPAAALRQAVCSFSASFSGVRNSAQHIPFLLWPSHTCSGQEPSVPPASRAQGWGEKGRGRPELSETPTRLEGNLLGRRGAAPPCSPPAETKPRLSQAPEEGGLGAQQGPERRLSGSFLGRGLCGTATRRLGGGWSCSLSIFSEASPVPPQGARSPPGLGTHANLLGGEGADAHACGVGLDHAVDLAYVLGRDAQASAHTAYRAVGGRHEGVGPCETEPAGSPPRRNPGEGSPRCAQGPLGAWPTQGAVCMRWRGGGGSLRFGWWVPHLRQAASGLVCPWAHQRGHTQWGQRGQRPRWGSWGSPAQPVSPSSPSLIPIHVPHPHPCP